MVWQNVNRWVRRVFWAIWLVLILGLLSTGGDYVRPGEMAVIKNNLTGGETVKQTDGVIFHAPLGLTRVLRLDKTQQVVRMTARADAGGRKGIDNVRLKTSDGTNVFVDVELVYNLDPGIAPTLIRTFGRGDAYKLGFVRSLARSRVRDALGQLSLQEVTRAEYRQEKAGEAMVRLNEDLSSFGLVVSSLSITDPDYSEQYKQMITERIKVEQEITNQQAAAQTATIEKQSAEAQAQRRKNTTLEQVRGEQKKRVIDAQGEAAKVVKEAEGESYRARKEGDQQLQMALAEARAVEQEGLKRAEGVSRMAAAYRDGGLALVREVLAKKYAGKQIRGRPYSLDSHVERLQIETPDGAAATTIKPGGKK